ncbi:hypothetical protein [Micromonospora yangpuensis]|uniref:Uncharacterized protein n=1 Tax=Micromonospora yangpuensis TaxID=683228 RepID=A0A1C6UR91_9ACTN|nr:hypothetical protein [Micromonospora yangpuensis]GGM07072.1 hypothetical protein GCM10012279_26280 [Micromonospora yangpuensis]SCL56567.1 hypothetical protein GA0070617_3276 [Micromonospora yangpuensis]
MTSYDEFLTGLHGDRQADLAAGGDGSSLIPTITPSRDTLRQWASRRKIDWSLYRPDLKVKQGRFTNAHLREFEREHRLLPEGLAFRREGPNAAIVGVRMNLPASTELTPMGLAAYVNSHGGSTAALGQYVTEEELRWYERRRRLPAGTYSLIHGPDGTVSDIRRTDHLRAEAAQLTHAPGGPVGAAPPGLPPVAPTHWSIPGSGHTPAGPPGGGLQR